MGECRKANSQLTAPSSHLCDPLTHPLTHCDNACDTVTDRLTDCLSDLRRTSLYNPGPLSAQCSVLSAQFSVSE